MAVNPLGPERSAASPFVKPFLQALDQMQDRETLQPSQLVERARIVLHERYDAREGPVEATFAHATFDLAAEHTHFFDGFALLMPVPYGAAVAVRAASEGATQVVFEGSATVFRRAASRAEQPPLVRALLDLLDAFVPAGQAVEVAVVCTIRPVCRDAYLAALVVAVLRALQALFALTDSTPDLLRRARTVLAGTLERPFSVAHLIAADAGRPDRYVLIDAERMEYLLLEAPARDLLGWGLISLPSDAHRDTAGYRQIGEQADRAVAILRKKGFEQLQSLRDLEHRDLQRALDQLPRRLRPTLRFLVSQNARVQKLVRAIRRRDWQMFGALLLMSHATLHNDAHLTRDPVDAIVDEVEGLILEGLYGACATAGGSCVLVVGQPFSVPSSLDQLREHLAERFDLAAETRLL